MLLVDNALTKESNCFGICIKRGSSPAESVPAYRQ